MTAGRLAGRVAVITGAGSGIGQGIALRFAEEGARVVVNDLSPARAGATVDEISAAGGEAVACAGDVAERRVAEELLGCALRTFDGCDALVNNAGILTMTPLLDLDDDEWDRVLRVNARSTFVCTQVLARHWVAARRPGRVVNIASTQAEMASTMGLAHYGASKGAVRMFTRMAAAELARHGITVNAIGPGTVPSGISDGSAVRAADSEALAADLGRFVPLGRAGRPGDVASLAVFMCSDEASYMTGQLVMLDGGRNLTAGEMPVDPAGS